MPTLGRRRQRGGAPLTTDLHERTAAEDLDASYTALFRELSGAFRARGLGAEEARDLAQESLVRTFVHLKRHGRTRPDLRPLAHTIAKRLYVERGRRRRPHLVDLPEAEAVADTAPEPLDEVVAREQREGVHAALRSLTPRHRRAVSMWMQGLRPAEIARELGIKRNAADALLHRARRQLALRLDRHGPGGSSLGLVATVTLQVRSLFRRAADGIARLDPSGAAAQATAGLAVAGVAAVLLAAVPAEHGRSRTTASAPVERIDAVEVAAAVPAAARQTIGTGTATARDVAEAVEYGVGAAAPFTNPATGEEDEISLGIRYLPEEEGTGLADPVLEPVARVGCAALSGTCVSER